MRRIDNVCLLGFGEVGQVLAEEILKSPARRIQAFDLLFDDLASLPRLAADEMPKVKSCGSAQEAAENCQLIVSAVTADQALPAAESTRDTIHEGVYFLDLNSVSPETKIDVANVINSSGGRFVEAAVMSPIEPERLASPILLGGPNAEGFLEQAFSLGFVNATFFSDQVGRAAATKMCRSVVIKGMEALLAESLVTARHYGVEDDVLESLDNLLTIDNWPEHAQYMILRSVEHGVRRAAEMGEAAKTVREAGVEPSMSIACVERQKWASTFRSALGEENLSEILDVFLSDQPVQAEDRLQ